MFESAVTMGKIRAENRRKLTTRKIALSPVYGIRKSLLTLSIECFAAWMSNT
jgi:hypothetical protein